MSQFRNRKTQAEGHSLGIIKQWFFHGSGQTENQLFLLSFESAIPLRKPTEERWMTSSPADASSFMPSRRGYNTVSRMGKVRRG